MQSRRCSVVPRYGKPGTAQPGDAFDDFCRAPTTLSVSAPQLEADLPGYIAGQPELIPVTLGLSCGVVEPDPQPVLRGHRCP